MSAAELSRPAPRSAPRRPAVARLLAAAVSDISGTQRPGQAAMAEAVHEAMRTGRHLAVQAGTGTGKSLAYLVPAVSHAVGRGGGTVVVSTATIALQRQLIDRDLPRLSRALAPLLGRAPDIAILKGRRNYLCLNKAHGGGEEEDPGGTLFAAPATATGRQVARLHQWAATTRTGDRDELVPGVDDRAWREVSVSAGECIGAQKCPFGSRCFAEQARAAAAEAHIVVTNHALLAIDAMQDYDVLPEHGIAVIDEAHELADRVRGAASGELSADGAEAAARRGARLAGEKPAAALTEAADGLRRVLAGAPPGRMDVLAGPVAAAIAAVRDAAAGCAAQLRAGAGSGEDREESLAGRAAEVALDEVSESAARLLGVFAAPAAERAEVVWLDRPGEDTGRPDTLRVAPLEVADVLAERLFAARTVILTSATLTIGGSFGPLARQWGLPEEGEAWTGLDVGSPFDHRRAGILYIARHLPVPGRDGLPGAYLTELRELIAAAGGRTLGLFSSMRAARQAADALREEIGVPLLCQGDDATAQLVSAFAADEATCLFGTLSLWQGVDVPGRALQLVVIDRIPFPRPDDPLASARQRAVEARGGNGFMEVAAAHAALLLAQGTGRLLRTVSDRGVIAILDPRMATRRYGGFLRDTLPPYWSTHDPQLVRGALRRLAEPEG